MFIRQHSVGALQIILQSPFFPHKRRLYANIKLKFFLYPACCFKSFWKQASMAALFTVERLFWWQSDRRKHRNETNCQWFSGRDISVEWERCEPWPNTSAIRKHVIIADKQGSWMHRPKTSGSFADFIHSLWQPFYLIFAKAHLKFHMEDAPALEDIVGFAFCVCLPCTWK